MLKSWLFFLIILLNACSASLAEKQKELPFIAPKGKTTLSENNYSKRTTLDINWKGPQQIEVTINLSNPTCGLRIGAIANRDTLSRTYTFTGNQPMDSILFIESDSCILYFKPDFGLSCELHQDSILFY